METGQAPTGGTTGRHRPDALADPGHPEASGDERREHDRLALKPADRRPFFPLLRDWLAACWAPPRCEACETLVPRPPALCAGCAAGLRPLVEPQCRVCALPFPAGTPPGRLCGDCLERPPSFQRARSAWDFEGTLPRLFHAFKFGGQVRALRLLLPVAVASFAASLQDFAPQALLPMPLGWWRRLRRGFNQSYVLTEILQKGLGTRLPHAQGIRRRGSPPQARRGRAERFRAMREAFLVTRRNEVRGLRILVVDDVMTTGATVEALSKSLLQAGAEAVQVWTLARRGRKETP